MIEKFLPIQYRNFKRFRNNFIFSLKLFYKKYRIYLGLFFLCCFGVIFYILWFSYLKDPFLQRVRESLFFLFKEMDFTVQTIEVLGIYRISQTDIDALLESFYGMPLLFVDLQEVQRRVLSLSWVKEVKIYRNLGHKALYLTIEERQPIAILEDDGRYSLVDPFGFLITVKDIGDYKNLLVINGVGARDAIGDLLAILSKESQLYPYVLTATRLSQRRWDIQLYSQGKSIVLKLPEHNVALSLRIVSYLHRKYNILNKSIKSIDLRYDQSILIETDQPFKDWNFHEPLENLL